MSDEQDKKPLATAVPRRAQIKRRSPVSKAPAPFATQATSKTEATQPASSARPSAPKTSARKSLIPASPFSPTSFPEQKPSRKRDSKDRPLPSGPDQSSVNRISGAKASLRTKFSMLDQTEGAEDSRKSPSGFALKNTKVSKNTISQYSKRGSNLIKRYMRECDIGADNEEYNPVEFVLWFFSLKPTLKASSYRVYRQSVYYVLAANPDPKVDDAIEMLDNDIMEGDLAQSSNEATGKKSSYLTSALKQKKFPMKDLERVLAYLRYKSRSNMATVLRDWLIASLYTGLRPVEWRATSVETFFDTEYEKKYVWLYVLNAKTTNNRGNGLVRTIDLSELPSGIVNAIIRMSENGLSWYEDGEYGDMQSQVSQLLYNIGRELFPRRKKFYSLYSCRHQFLANMKTILSHEEVAALAGHNTTETAISNYGKARNAWLPSELRKHVKPIPEEVATVKQTQDYYEMRKAGIDMALKGD